jgi:hypothetical protein
VTRIQLRGVSIFKRLRIKWKVLSLLSQIFLDFTLCKSWYFGLLLIWNIPLSLFVILFRRICLIKNSIFNKVSIIIIHCLGFSYCFSWSFEAFGKSWLVLIESSSWHISYWGPLWAPSQSILWLSPLLYFIWSCEITVMSICKWVNWLSLLY